MIVSGEFRTLPKAGETANGDRPFLRVEAEGRAIFGVIDALGHGPEAELVSLAATEFLRAASLDTPLLDIMEELHRKLAGMRGAAATVCLLKERELHVCAVGNVELRSTDMRFPLVFSAGILGVSVRKFRICSARVLSPARFVAFSDGISTRVSTDAIRRLTPEAACHHIITEYRRDTDDATVLVADLG